MRYEALVSLYEATKAERDRVAAEIRQKGIRRREFQRFITTLEKLPEEVTIFKESMWNSLVDYVTVSGKDDLQFTLVCGTEMAVFGAAELFAIKLTHSPTKSTY